MDRCRNTDLKAGLGKKKRDLTLVRGGGGKGLVCVPPCYIVFISDLPSYRYLGSNHLVEKWNRYREFTLSQLYAGKVKRLCVEAILKSLQLVALQLLIAFLQNT